MKVIETRSKAYIYGNGLYESNYMKYMENINL